MTDLCASVGDRSSLKVDFLQNERLEVSATDGDCLFNNIEVCTHELVPGTVSEGVNGWSEALTAGLAVDR